ncbi:MAG TPA: methyltransferase domain-containing protein [Patescibacteria group bacterium]|nr:methyltransferase domain-containing protein [Patescibacteria group bacterium]
MINGFFKIPDIHTNNVAGIAIHPVWWSRHYEYVWAFQFVKPKMVVADMGCGYSYRPFKNILATQCTKVYAVDGRDEARSQVIRESNIELVIADFARPIKEIKESSLDRVFCLSVLEEGVDIASALTEFGRVLKPDGLIVLTFDVISDPSKPVGVYEGVNLNKFFIAVETAGLEVAGGIDLAMENRLTHPDWNLSVFHCVLWRKDFPKRIENNKKTDKVLEWIQNQTVKSGGIAAWPGQGAYTEVSGYMIPTLLAHGKVKLANSLADWLLTIQESGAFRGLDGRFRSFDTAACIEGLQVAAGYFGNKIYSQSALLAKNWIRDNATDSEGKIFSQTDHKELRNYSLRVNGIVGIRPEWFYSQDTDWPFGDEADRTHYIAYALEGLLALGETEKVKAILNSVETVIIPPTLVTYWVKPNWNPSKPIFACHNASAQIGLILSKLQIKPELRSKLLNNLLNVVGDDGGIPTTIGSVDTSWTAKWFLDFEEAEFDSKVQDLILS